MKRKVLLPTPVYQELPWTLVLAPMSDHDGLAYREERIIYVASNQSKKLQRMAAIHEVDHAIRFDDEERAAATEKAMWQVLNTLGLWGD